MLRVHVQVILSLFLPGLGVCATNQCEEPAKIKVVRTEMLQTKEGILGISWKRGKKYSFRKGIAIYVKVSDIVPFLPMASSESRYMLGETSCITARSPLVDGVGVALCPIPGKIPATLWLSPRGLDEEGASQLFDDLWSHGRLKLKVIGTIRSLKGKQIEYKTRNDVLKTVQRPVRN